MANPSAEFAANGAGGVIQIITQNGERSARLYAGSGGVVVDYESVEPYSIGMNRSLRISLAVRRSITY